MKILELRWKNLNSLYGEWIIDFTHPEYVSNGIFALTGPTGAGKSTILDAVCLALYGTTPRLGRITKSSNEIMSRQSGECYAEVLFESRLGRFRCHWEQRRARKKPTGALQDQEHQIADGDTGNLIETKKSLVPAIIEEKTGMDFDRFTRSMLLAQGGFDTFLTADTEQKSRILEQITGTGIYTEISLRVHEKSRNEHEKLELLKAESSGITLLSPEEQLDIEENLKESQHELQNLSDTYEKTNAALSWLNSLESVKQDIKLLDHERTELQKRQEAFKSEHSLLDRARRADSLEPVYIGLSALRKHQKEDTDALSREQEAMPAYEKAVKQELKALSDAEKQTQIIKQSLADAVPLLKQVNSLDQTISEIQKLQNSANQAAAKTDENLNDLLGKVKEQKEIQHELGKEHSELERYLSVHKDDEKILSSFDNIQEQLEGLQLLRRSIKDKMTALEKVKGDLRKVEKKYASSKKRSREQSAEVKRTDTLLREKKASLANILQGKHLREYRNEKEGLLREMTLYVRIAELEEHRTRLEDGKPCPLCGSTEHPYAEGNVPVPDEIEQKINQLTDLIQSVETSEIETQHIEHDLSEAKEKQTEAATAQEKALHAKQHAESEAKYVQKELTELSSSEQDLQSRLIFRLREIGFELTEITDSTNLLESLSVRLRDWRKKSSSLLSLNEKLSEIAHEVKRLESLLEVQKIQQREHSNRLVELKMQHDKTKSKRTRLFGDKETDEEQKRLQLAAAGAETYEKERRDQYYVYKERVTSTQASISKLTDRIEKRIRELNEQESKFLSSLEQAGFTDQSQFLEARLDTDRRSELEHRAKELDEQQTELRAREKDCIRRLEELKKQRITEKSREEIKPLVASTEQELYQLRDKIAGLNHRLEEQHKAKERLQEKQVAMGAQRAECDRWDRLHTLIGSSDGKKYRNFAQGLTFDLMVSHANRELEKMSDRYLLIRDENLALELNVVDNYQAGEIRSTRNLSGGESFIVSLSLALGLSGMSSRRVKVDTLFLDEGFGTLDEQSLETALETLAGLHQEGKLIGIISHVGALKERITTQITINPAAGGRSLVQGPGCQKV